MSRSSRHRATPARLLPILLAWLAVTASARADLPWSRLDALFPAGAKAGSTVQIRLAGAELDQAPALRFSHPGITGRRVEGSSPSENLFQVQVAADVPPGLYDIATLGDLGISSLRTFAVATRDETVEIEVNESIVQANHVSLGQVINGRIEKPTDIDAYRFHAGPGRPATPYDVG